MKVLVKWVKLQFDGDSRVGMFKSMVLYFLLSSTICYISLKFFIFLIPWLERLKIPEIIPISFGIAILWLVIAMSGFWALFLIPAILMAFADIFKEEGSEGSKSITK